MNEKKVENKMKYELLENNYKRPIINRSESIMKYYDLGMSPIENLPPGTAETTFSTQNSALNQLVAQHKHPPMLVRTRYNHWPTATRVTDISTSPKNKIKVEIPKLP